MLVILILIFVLLWAAVVWSIYSSFLVFYSNFSESENYHKAYYTSISALERGELVVKQRKPGYVWSGWFILGTWQWGNPNNINDWLSDKSLAQFSYLWDHPDISSVFRTINSRASRIPEKWKWNVESMLAANDSSWYNMMDYENAEVFLLYRDDSTGNPYSNWSIEQETINEIKWIIRLPQKLYNSSSFTELDMTHQSLWAGESRPKNDAMVDRQIRWLYPGWSVTPKIPFTIYSTQTVNWSSITYEVDTVFRERDINENVNFNFWNDWDPIKNTSTHWLPSHSPKIISQREGDIAHEGNFKNIFNSSSETQLRFSLLNQLKDLNKKTYPFLEYYIEFKWNSAQPAEVSDKYFTIKWEWNYSDYNIHIIFQKPTVKETVLSNFTPIF